MLCGDIEMTIKIARENRSIAMAILLLAGFVVLKTPVSAEGVHGMGAKDNQVLYKDAVTHSSMHSGKRWNDFFHSPQGLLKAHQTYKIQLQYKIVESKDNTNFYAMLRRASKPEEITSRTAWGGTPSSSGESNFTVSTGDIDDYLLIIGIENQGAIDVHRLSIERQ